MMFWDHRLSRRFALLIAVLVVSPLTGQEPIDLKVEFSKDGQCRVDIELEHDGQVVVIPDEAGEETQSLDLRVSGKLGFFQRTIGPQQAIRFYREGTADIKLADGATQPELAAENRLIIARMKSDVAGRAEMASVTHTLSQPELELIQTPADPLALSELFDRSDIRAGDTWDPELPALARFLNVDSIISSDVQLTFKELDGKIARIFLAGSIVADVHDVTTEMSVNGIAWINVETARIRSLKVGVQEKRPVGQIAPGFSGRTRINVAFDFDQSTEQLNNQSLAKTVRSKTIQQRLLFESESGGFRIRFEPRWKLIAGDDGTALLRFIDQGELLSQCNAVLMPQRPADKPLALEKFKLEIGKVLDVDNNARVVKSGQSKTDHDLTALRVVVHGEEEELPVTWYYYHLSDAQGRQISFVFTMAESVASRVETAANQLVNEFQFIESAQSVATKSEMAGSEQR